MISIIIPAHNEASVIARCCQSLVNKTSASDLEIIVVCNGCTDNTASIAKSTGNNIKVIETDVASKSNALNIGDCHATGFPRFYVDADVVIPLNAIRETVSVLKENGFLAAAPQMHVDCSDRPWTVKAFYHVWLKLPYCHEGMIGSGVYALSENGRKRFKDFPNITSDDGYVRLLFTPQERITVKSCTFTIFPPKNLRGIINIKTRAFFGKLELQQNFPELLANEGTYHSTTIKGLLTKPRWWGPLAIYFYVRIISRLKALYRFRRKISHEWDRDETSRR